MGGPHLVLGWQGHHNMVPPAWLWFPHAGPLRLHPHPTGSCAAAPPPLQQMASFKAVWHSDSRLLHGSQDRMTETWADHSPTTGMHAVLWVSVARPMSMADRLQGGNGLV